MAKAVNAVLFDLDDTLCSYRRSGEELLAVAFEREGVEPFFAVTEYYDRYSAFAAAADSVRELREECFAAIAAERGYDRALGRALARTYAAERDHRDVAFLPGAREAVDALAGEHALGVVTNGPPEMQNQKLEAIGLADAFETVVYAGYDVAPKPDPAPFRRALSALDVEAERAVHVGNSLADDVAGAHAAGLRAVWVPSGPRNEGSESEEHGNEESGNEEPESETRADYTLRSLSDLVSPPWR